MTRRAVILDRDGVINDNRKPVNTAADLVLFDVTASAVRLLNESGFLVVVATNQGGVGLGYLSEAELAEVHRTMVERLAAQGARLDDILACTHAPQDGCACRKPQPGMLRTLAERNHFDLTTSFMVGDRETDIQAGQAAGTRTVYIGRPLRSKVTADYNATDLLDAARWITRGTNGEA